MPGWSLTTLRRADGTTTAAIRRHDGSYVVPDLLRAYAGLKELLEDWSEQADALRELDPDAWETQEGQEMLSIQYPGKVMCVGANYRDHLAEMGVADIPERVDPYFFMVPPETTLVGDRATIVLGEKEGLRPDWEAELAIVIGRRASNVGEEDAGAYIAGYACFNDITARGLMRRADPIAVPFTWDWAASKGRDTYSPLGAMTPSWQIDDPEDIGIRCFVNDVKKQDGRTSNLIAGIARLVAAASRSWTLQPGDIIASGTPAGVGHSQGEELRAGDVVRVEIDGLAPLTNTVVLSAEDLVRSLSARTVGQGSRDA